MTTFASPRSYTEKFPLAPPDQPTPQSPPLSFMSNNHEPSNTMTPFNSSTNTPPAPQVSFTLDPSKPLNQSDANSLPTPGSNGAPNSVHGDPDGDSPMTDISFGELKMHKRRRTSSSFDAGHHTLPPNLRQCSSDTNEKMANAPPASMPRIQELLSNPDCSPYYLVCEKTHKQSYPDPTENLLQIYGLKPIADKVARFDATGKKNKLRKSYKGHIAGLSGKIEVVSRPTQLGHYPTDDPGSDPNEYKLQRLAYYPEEEWNLQNVLGKDLHRGIDLGRLRRGLAGITKGDIPGYDASVLGLDDEPPRKRLENARSPPVAFGGVGTPQKNGSTPGNVATASGAANGEDLRPKRLKRRRYDEGSYEGYDVFEDDEPGGNGPAGGGGIGGGGSGGGGTWDGDKKKKKRKKNPPDVNSPGMSNFTTNHHHEIAVQSNMIYGQ